MPPRPVILLCWGYNRSGWIYVFEKLKQDFEFVYLYYRNVREEQNPVTDCRKIYWEDFNSGVEVIDKIKPSKIIFMSITSGYTIALNCAAKSKGIPTAILQHGLFRTYKEYRILESQDKAKPREATSSGQTSADSGFKRTFKFLLRSLPLTGWIALPRLLLYFYLQRKKGVYFAAKKIFLKQRLPDKYICYTPVNAGIHKELDRVTDKKIDYVGVPELDTFFDESYPLTPSIQGDYYLLIDQPFGENQYFNLAISKDKMNEMYEKLASWCETNNSRLVVKLHPESYKSGWLLKHPAITYIRDADITSLIKNATAIFGATSTLMLPAIFLKPVFLLLIHDSVFQERILELGLAKGGDFLSFIPADINFVRVKEKTALLQFEKEFLYKADGHSTDRVKESISDPGVSNVHS